MLREEPNSSVLRHFVQRILPQKLDSSINMLVVPYVKDNFVKLKINDKLVVVIGFFDKDGNKNIQYFSNSLPKYWIRNYEKNMVAINTLIASEESSESSSTKHLEELKVKYYSLKEQLHGFKDTIKKHDEIELRLIKEFNSLTSDELSDLTKEYDNLKLELNEYNIVKLDFDETYKEIMKFYRNLLKNNLK